MKKNKIYIKLLLAGFMLLPGAFTSCEDFLTLYPTDKISEEDFWEDKNDLDNVRAAVYRQMISDNVMRRALIWGEFRSDNLTLNKMDQTAFVRLQDAILMPTENMFDWGPFYTGINYCNKVLENGQRMVEEGVDPSFKESDWLPIKAEMLAMRALNYFYLIRAYRDIPYVEASVNTDAEAMNSRIAATPGVIILGKLIEQLEGMKEYPLANYGNLEDNKGRITKRSFRMLLADMYLWRGCMLEKQDEKSDHLVDENGQLLPRATTDAMAKECYAKAVEHASFVIDDMKREYDDNLKLQTNVPSELANQPYPLIRLNSVGSGGTDNIYSSIWGENSSESILELQIDGVDVANTAWDLMTTYSSPNLQGQTMVANPLLFSSVTSVNPSKGYGKTDLRFLSTAHFEKVGQYTCVILKNIAQYISVEDFSDMTAGYMSSPLSSCRTSKNGNFPIYRLSDAMLVKAEALARSNTDLAEGFRLVNQLFARYNPRLVKSTDASAAREELKCNRLDDNYADGKKNTDLLNLVYNERQLEFLGEGKRWFDLARQAEAENSTTNVLSTMMGAKKSVTSRLRELSGMYNPIYSEELKVNGVAGGGKLTQNPTWERYSKN